MQTLGGRDHEPWSNEHLPGIDSADTPDMVEYMLFLCFRALIRLRI